LKKSLIEEFPSVINRVYQLYKRYPHVEDIMTKDPLAINSSATVLEAGRIMGERHIGSLLASKRGKHVGIVTERDLLSKVIVAGKSLGAVKVNDIMSTTLVTIKPIASVKEAARKMIKEKGRLVVMEEGRAVGIATASDLVKALPAVESNLKVDDAMTPKVTMVDEDTLVEAAVGIMGQKRIGSVIVTRADHPIAIFTERDLLTKIIAADVSLKTRVGDVASSPLVAVSPDLSIHEAAKLMSEKHVRRLPVVASDGKMVGVVTARDLVEAYAR